MIAVGQGASETNAGILAHIMIDRNDATELLDMVFHLVEQEE